MPEPSELAAEKKETAEKEKEKPDLAGRIKELEELAARTPRGDDGAALYVFEKEPTPAEYENLSNCYVFNKQTARFSFVENGKLHEPISSSEEKGIADQLNRMMGGATAKRLTASEFKSLGIPDPVVEPWTVANGVTIDYISSPLDKFALQVYEKLEEKASSVQEPQQQSLKKVLEEFSSNLNLTFKEVHRLQKTPQFEQKWPEEQKKILKIRDEAVHELEAWKNQQTMTLNSEIISAQINLLKTLVPWSERENPNVSSQNDFKEQLSAKLKQLRADSEEAKEESQKDTLQRQIQLLEAFQTAKNPDDLQPLLKQEAEIQKTKSPQKSEDIEQQQTLINQKIQAVQQVQQAVSDLTTKINEQLSSAKLKEQSDEHAKWMFEVLKKQNQAIMLERIHAAMVHKRLSQFHPYLGGDGKGRDAETKTLGSGMYSYKVYSAIDGKDAENFNPQILINQRNEKVLLQYNQHLKRVVAQALPSDSLGRKIINAMRKPFYADSYDSFQNRRATELEMDAMLELGRNTITMLPAGGPQGLEPNHNYESQKIWLLAAFNKQYDFRALDEKPADTTGLQKNSYLLIGKRDHRQLFYVNDKGELEAITQPEEAKELEEHLPKKRNKWGLIDLPLLPSFRLPHFNWNTPLCRASGQHDRIEFRSITQFEKMKGFLLEKAKKYKDGPKPASWIKKDSAGGDTIRSQGILMVNDCSGRWSQELTYNSLNSKQMAKLMTLQQMVNQAGPEAGLEKKPLSQSPVITGTHHSPPPLPSPPPVPGVIHSSPVVLPGNQNAQGEPSVPPQSPSSTSSSSASATSSPPGPGSSPESELDSNNRPKFSPN